MTWCVDTQNASLTKKYVHWICAHWISKQKQALSCCMLLWTRAVEGGCTEQTAGPHLPRATHSSSPIFLMLSASFSYSRYSRKVLTGSTLSASSEKRTVALVFSCLYFSNKARSFRSSLSSSLSKTARSCEQEKAFSLPTATNASCPLTVQADEQWWLLKLVWNMTEIMYCFTC